MTIDKLGPIDPVSKYNKTEKVSKPSNRERTDSIDFSQEAKSKGEVYKVSEEVKLTPEIRQDRIDEVKKKLEDPNYIDDRVVETVAERVIDLFQL